MKLLLELGAGPSMTNVEAARRSLSLAHSCGSDQATEVAARNRRCSKRRSCC